MQKLSEVTVTDIANALRLDDYDADWLETLKNAAVSYMEGQTGCDKNYMDKYPEFIPAMMVLIQDMHDNRAYQVSNSNTNKVIDSILFQHRRNFL